MVRRGILISMPNDISVKVVAKARCHCQYLNGNKGNYDIHT
jgi:hypothetical protein